MELDFVYGFVFREDGAGIGGVHVVIVLDSIMLLNSFTFFNIFVSALVLLGHVSSMDRSATIRHATHIWLLRGGDHLCIFLLQVVVHRARKFLLDLRVQQIPFKGRLRQLYTFSTVHFIHFFIIASNRQLCFARENIMIFPKLILVHFGILLCTLRLRKGCFPFFLTYDSLGFEFSSWIGWLNFREQDDII